LGLAVHWGEILSQSNGNARLQQETGIGRKTLPVLTSFGAVLLNMAKQTMKHKVHYTIIGLALLGCAKRTEAQTNWTELSANGPMPIRAGQSTVVNSSNGRMIVFGGYPLTPPNSALNDVWIFQDVRGDATNTSQQLSIGGTLPAVRSWPSVVYDQADNRMIVFGGDGSPGYCYGALNDVWVLTNADGTGGTPGWTQLSPTGKPPSPRRTAGAAYDSANNRMIIYGGGNACESPLGDVWVLTAANGLAGTLNWTQLNVAGESPAGRFVCCTVYDATNNMLIVFGGQTATVAATNDTWVLSHANGLGGTPTWTLLNPAGPLPVPRDGAVAAYNSTLNALVVFGGETITPNDTNDTWLLSNANGLGGTPAWTLLNPTGALPGGRVNSSCVGLPGTNRLIICAGQYEGEPAYNDVWALQYSLSLPVPPPVLSIAVTGNQSVLYWSASATNYVLQTTTNLSSSNWVTVSNGLPIIGVALTNVSSASFFRLQQQ
jgi:hypothetical protein